MANENCIDQTKSNEIINVLNECHSFLTKHLNKSFGITVGMVFGGFLIIGAGFIFANNNDRTIYYLFSGIIIEIISLIYYLSYTKTIRALKKYYDNVNFILISLKLIDIAKDEENKSDIINKIMEVLTHDKNI